MSPVQRATSEHTRRIVILLGIVVGGLWLAMTVYFLVDSKQTTNASKSAVAIHATSPVAIGSTPSATYKAPRVAATPIVHHEAVSASQWSFVQKTTPTTGSMHIYQTSDATVKSIGGGGNTGGIATTNGHGNNGRGVQFTTMAYTGAIYIPMTNNAITAVGATQAEEVVEQKMGITARKAKMTDDGQYPGGRPDPVPDEEDPTPIGDVAWPLMALLTIGWCVRVRLKKQ